MAIKSFADTSAVSLAYGFTDAANTAEVDLQELKYIPFTTEGFTMAKEAQVSQAITASRRSKGSKNTKGSASGAFTIEFGAADFCLDMLQALLMNKWKQDGGVMTIHDGDLKQYMVVEKTIRPSRGEEEKQSHEQFFGTLINDGTLELGDGELITLALNTISANAEYTEALQGEDGTGGSLVLSKEAPADYEIADASNNVKNIKITNLQGEPLELTFSSATLNVENNVREQPGIGHVFAAGIGMGKVGVNMSGEVYYYDQTLLDVHMRNERIKAEMTLETRDGKFEIFLPNLIAQSPSSNAGGENQDYTTSIELVAEEGEHEGVKCVIFIKYTPADEATLPGQINIDELDIDDIDKTFEISGTTFNIADGNFITATIKDVQGNTAVFDQIEVQGNAFEHTAINIGSLIAGRLEFEFTAEDLQGDEVKVTAEGFMAVVQDAGISVNLDYAAQTLDVLGTTTAIPSGAEVSISITDSQGASAQPVTTTVQNDAFEALGIDISGLVGMLTVEVLIEDYPASITELVDNAAPLAITNVSATIDPVTGLLTIAVDTQGFLDNTPVSIEIEDEDNQAISVTSEVLGNQIVKSNIDVSSLVDGTLSIEGVVGSETFNTNVTKDTSITLGNLVGIINNGKETAAFFLEIPNAVDGIAVTAEIEDSQGQKVTFSGLVVENESVETEDIDISSLEDGELTVRVEISGESKESTMMKGADYTVETTSTVDDSGQLIDSTGIVGVGVGFDGQEVEFLVEDEDGEEAEEITTNQSNTFEIHSLSISALKGGTLTVTASVESAEGWIAVGTEEVTYTP